MSPASSGALEVERYVGACLISSQSRSKALNPKGNGRNSFFQRQRLLPRHIQNNPNPQKCRSVDGWAGGVPLISFANYQRRDNMSEEMRMQNHNPLSRLAVHTQGAPLILTSKYHQKRNKPSTKNLSQTKGLDGGSKTKDITQGADTVSVNSDESSASTNSENSLPRIIKPRKRRKKDRKPPLLARSLTTDDCFSTDSASPDIDSPTGIISINSYLPFAFDQFYYPRNIDIINNNISTTHNKLKFKSDVQEIPQLLHKFEDIEDISKNISDNQTASSCQCRYCDPSGQIWDVDRHCYSPFLTSPELQNIFSFPDIQVKALSNNKNSSSSELIECMATLSLDSKRTKIDSSISESSRDLEVSTEIVTSHNGHRDLEIKFFSSLTSPGNSKKGTLRTLSLEEYRFRSDINGSVRNNKCNSLNLKQ